MTLVILAIETLLAPVAALGVILAFLFSPKRRRLAGLIEELPERFGSVAQEAYLHLHNRDIWWFHAASAGEVSGLAPLLEILSRDKSIAIVMTTTTLSGRHVARLLPYVAWAQLAPIDAWPFISRFMARIKPRRLIVTETELWPSTLLLASRRGLAPVLVNARLSDQSLLWYRLLQPFLRIILRSISLVAAQSKEDLERFVSLGLPREVVTVTGNTKYDRQQSAIVTNDVHHKIASLGWSSDPIFVAGSTHPFEEEMVIAAFLCARRALPRLRLALAPRHLERSKDTADLLAHAGVSFCRWNDAPLKNEAVLLIDQMGILSSFYPSARIAFVGGTLVKIGGHNLLDPASAGIPVLFGPHTFHIAEPARLLLASGGGRSVRDADDLSRKLVELVSDFELARTSGVAAKSVADRLRGACARTVAALGS